MRHVSVVLIPRDSDLCFRFAKRLCHVSGFDTGRAIIILVHTISENPNINVVNFSFGQPIAANLK